MVRMGAAWAYREYLRDRSLLTLESEAKADKRGVWGLSEAQNMAPLRRSRRTFRKLGVVTGVLVF